MSTILVENGTEADFDIIAGNFDQVPISDDKFALLQPFAQYLGKIKDNQKFQKGIDMIASFRDKIPANYQAQTTPFFNNVVLNSIITQKTAALKENSSPDLQAQIDYVKAKIQGKKGF